MNKDEALKMAIEAMKWLRMRSPIIYEELEAEKACKEALDTEQVREDAVQPAQEPVAIVESHYGFTDAIVTFLTENNEQLPIGTLLYAEKEKNHG